MTLCETHQVEFVWVRGHAGNRENERCDELAVQASKQGDLPADEGYRQAFDPQDEGRQRPPVTQNPSTAKITQEGQPCRKCSTPVVKRTPRRHNHRNGQCCYYEYYLYCPRCCTLYMVEDAKRPWE